MDSPADYPLDLFPKPQHEEVRYVQERPAELESLLNPTVGDGAGEGKKSRVKELRRNTVVETALAQGSQAALSWRYGQINDLLERYEGKLDQAINFRPFVEQGRVMVPSIVRKKDVERYKSGQLAEVKVSYTIGKEAQIVSAPPTFRDYLIKDFPPPAPPHAALLPRNADEEKAWREAVERGWQLGLKQAEDIFADSLAAMSMDIDGRITYVEMRALNMVSPATLRAEDMGVTFNGRTMNVGETVYQITDPTQFRQIEGWRAAWTVEDTGRRESDAR